MSSDRPAAGRSASARQQVRAGRSRQRGDDGSSRRLLAIETATSWLGLAAFEGDALRAEVSRDVSGKHAERLLPEIDALMASLGWAPDALDGMVVSIGPGSFTGLRVGLATAKGIAFEGEPPVAAVSTLAALAASTGSSRGPVASLLDARRGEVYAGVWSRAGIATADLVPESVFGPDALAAELPAGCEIVVGEGATGVAEQLLAGRPDLVGSPAPTRVSAVALGRMGAAALAAGEGISADALVPRYLRRAEAEVKRTGEALEPS